MPRIPKWLILTLAVFLVAGCGTRVQRIGGGSEVGLGRSASTSGPASGSAAIGTSGLPAGPGATAGGSGGGSSSGSAAAGTATGAGSALGSPLTGGTSGGSSSGTQKASVTGTTINIGYTYSNTAAFKQFGAACPACATFGDETYMPAFYAQLGNYLNSQGGVLSHKFVFTGYAYNSSTAVSDSAQLNTIVQSACQNFTTDNPVFAVVTSFGQLISPCLTKYKVSTVLPSGGIGDTIDEKALSSSLIYTPGVSQTDQYEPVFVARLQAQKYFSGWDPTAGTASPAPPKIGMVSFSDSQLATQDQLLAKAVTAAGYKIADHIWYSAELDVQSQAVQNAILKFRSEGITHVMGTGANGLFMYESVGQNYYPRYAYQTGSISDTDANSQKGLQGSMGVGIFPTSDVDPSANPPSVGPVQTQCEQLATKAGVGWQSNQGFHADILSTCDAVLELAAALAKGGSLTPQGLSTGFSSLGTRASGVTFSETWSPSRLASADTVGDFQYNTGCSCFKYTGTRTKF